MADQSYLVCFGGIGGERKEDGERGGGVRRSSGFEGSPQALHLRGGLLRAVGEIDGEVRQGSWPHSSLYEGGTDDAQPETAACTNCGRVWLGV